MPLTTQMCLYRQTVALPGGRAGRLSAAGIVVAATAVVAVIVVTAYAEQDKDKDNDPAAVAAAKVEA